MKSKTEKRWCVTKDPTRTVVFGAEKVGFSGFSDCVDWCKENMVAPDIHTIQPYPPEFPPSEENVALAKRHAKSLWSH